MTKDEKVFLTGLIKGLEGRFDGLEQRMDGFEERVNTRFEKIDQRFEKIDQRFEKIDQRFEGLEGKFVGLEAKVEQNSRDIRVNGMQIESMRDDLAQIKEGDSFAHVLNIKVDALMESMGIDIPALQHAVSNHSKRIRALEAKRV